MITARDVANYFLSLVDEDQGDSISNLRLQKLMYYAQGYLLALKDRPLIHEEFEAWEHGPVIPGLYNSFRNTERSRSHCKAPIRKNFCPKRSST